MKANPKPLEGLRVLDLTRYLAGPYCTMLLGGLGAEVIKIERPGRGDIYRNRAPFGGPMGVSSSRQTPQDVGLGLVHRARNKKSITLNLHESEGQEILRSLCKNIDVVVENYSPGIMADMGCDYETLKVLNEKIIVCSISGFGQNGPLRDWRAYDPIAQAMGGIMAITGFADKAPVRCGAAIADTVAPLVAVIGILSALLRRGITGKGDWVDVAMLDVLAFLLPEVIEFYQAGMMEFPLENRHPGGVPFNTFAASDGHVSLACITDKDWYALLHAMDRKDLLADPRFTDVAGRRSHLETVEGIVTEWTGKQKRDAVVATLQQYKVVCGPVMTLDEVMRSAQLRARGMFPGLELPTGETIPNAVGAGMPIRFTEGPLKFDKAAPQLGEHNAAVYRDLAGIDESALEGLGRRGIV
ncbi:MAG: CoA transferase [Gammaproteobacteria bacterium]